MTAPVLTAVVVPIGGVIALSLPAYTSQAAIAAAGTITLSRQTNGGAFVQLYSGPPVVAWIDPGDSSPSSLAPTSSYVYQLTDANGTATTTALTPASTLQPPDNSQTQLLIRLLQAGVNNLTLPTGINSVQVTTQMPLGGWSALPFIVVNLDLVQQQDTMIGEDFQAPDSNNTWTIPTWAKYLWRITILSRNAAERDYYRDNIIAICRVLKATVFSFIGSNMRHEVQAASGTDVDEWSGKQPGFYYADVMFSVEGVLDAIVLTNYGAIKSFAVTPTGVSAQSFVIDVPPPL